MFVQNLIEHASRSKLWTLFLLSAGIFIIYTFRNYFKAVFLSLKLSGPPAVPILVMSKHVANFFKRYGSLPRFWILLFPSFFIIQPEDLQLILSSSKHTGKGLLYRFMHNFLGNGLITSSGDRWYNHRRLIQPAFHLNILKRFIGTFADASQALYETLDGVDKTEINIAEYVNNCVMGILNEAVLGVPIKTKNNKHMEQSPFRQGKLVMPQRFIKPWLLLDSIYHKTKLAADELNQKKRLSEFTRKMIAKRRELKKNNNNEVENKCLLDYMIDISENNPDFTENDIVDEACTFMLAGQDSVGAAMAFTIFLLAQNLDCQEKCEAEIEHIFGNDNRAPTMEDLRDMRYLEMCIKESLRLYPSVPAMARKLGEEVRLAKYTLPAGSNVFICPYATHRLEHIYPDPERFDPERFTPENSEKRHSYSYLPFSAGPRYCIGNRFAILEMKTVISRLLRSYHIQPVPGKTALKEIFRITLRASGGLWVRLKPKEQKMTNFSN